MWNLTRGGVGGWQWAPWAKTLLQSGVLQPQLALFCVSDVGIHLLHQIPNKRIVGSIVLPEISMVSAILMIHDVDYFLNYVKFAVISCFFVKFEPLAFHKVQWLKHLDRVAFHLEYSPPFGFIVQLCLLMELLLGPRGL